MFPDKPEVTVGSPGLAKVVVKGTEVVTPLETVLETEVSVMKFVPALSSTALSRGRIGKSLCFM